MIFQKSLHEYTLDFMNSYFGSKENALKEYENGKLISDYNGEKLTVHHSGKLVFQVDFTNLYAGKGSKIGMGVISNVWSVLS